MGIAVILVSVALPSFKDSINRGLVSSPFKSLFSTLALAKTEAVSRNLPVIVCASADQESCSGSWSDGWMAFVDVNKNGRFNEAAAAVADDPATVEDESLAAVATGDEVLAVSTALNSQIRLVFVPSAASGSADTTSVTFNRQGYATGSSGDFIFCHSGDGDEPVSARAVLLFESGVMRRSKDSDDSGSIHEASDGDITC
jgi:type IV fimbrial biogenesis protein FimT